VIPSCFGEVVRVQEAAESVASLEVLLSEGDMVGKTAAEHRALHFARDREYLQTDV
jgi:hypothetical protein